MDSQICATLLDQHPVETLCIALDGEVKFANRSARTLLDAAEGAAPGNFFELVDETDSALGERVRRCAGSSAWQPISVSVRAGANRGLRVAMRCRGAMDAATGELTALLVGDPLRPAAFEEHRRLIRQLNAELAEQARIRAQLDEALANQARLNTELVHRVKNNLALLTSLIRSKKAASDNDEVRNALDEIQARLMSVALVHDVLDRNRDVDVIDARELLEMLCDQMENSICPPGVTIKRDLTSYRLHVTEATPLALLVNELVTNSIKHAFRDRAEGQVDVALRRNGVDKIEVHVADNGAGFEGDGNGDGDGTGSRIVRALAEQLHGDLSVTSGNGTSWQLIFKPSLGPRPPDETVH